MANSIYAHGQVYVITNENGVTIKRHYDYDGLIDEVQMHYNGIPCNFATEAEANEFMKGKEPDGNEFVEI